MPHRDRTLLPEPAKSSRAKCAACHGPDLAKPEGRFGYVLDLRRIAANPEMVIPGSPDESELWVLVKKGEMPPPDSADVPLTEIQKEIIRTWIESGAPVDNVHKAAPSQLGRESDRIDRLESRPSLPDPARCCPQSKEKKTRI